MVTKEKIYYSTTEAAEILGISRVAVLKRIKNKSLPAQKVGRNYIINRADLLDITGEVMTEAQKKNITKAVRKAVKEYGDVFEKLARE